MNLPCPSRKRTHRRSPPVAAALLLEPRTHFSATTLYVDATATGANTGATWPNAYTSLQTAIAHAASGATIKIAAGTYSPSAANDPSATFQLPVNTTLIGGFAGSHAPDPDAAAASVTVLTGTVGSGASTGNAYHVVSIHTTNVTVQNLVIQNGDAVGSFTDAEGAGAFITASSAITFDHVTFTNNLTTTSTSGFGGAVFLDATSAATFTSDTFTLNGSGTGGAIYTQSPSLSITDCTFANNAAATDGGAIELASGTSQTVPIYASTFHDNQSAFGGAIEISGSNANIVNSVFYNNSATSNGGAIENVFSSTTVVLYCTMSQNHCGAAGGAIDDFQSTVFVLNSILLSNPSNDTTNTTPDLFTFSNTTPASVANITTSFITNRHDAGIAPEIGPRFVDPSAGDFRLRISTFTNLDHGTITGPIQALTTTDKLGVVRSDLFPSPGAFETPVDVTPPTTTISAPPLSKSTQIQLKLTETDDSDEAVDQQIFVSDDGGAFAPIADSFLSDFTFIGLPNHTYGFYVVGTDTSGNVESKPAVAEVTTLIDQLDPVSSVSALPTFTNAKTFTVSWTGTDLDASATTAHASGVATYDIFVSDDGGLTFTPFQTDTAATSASFTGEEGKTYTFRSIATDHAGNVEAERSTADVSTTIDTIAPTLNVIDPPAFIKDDTNFPILFSGSDNAGGSGISRFQISYTDNGVSAAPIIVTDPAARDFDFAGTEGHTYVYTVTAFDNAGNTAASSPSTTTIDTIAPVSSVTALPAQTTTAGGISLTFTSSDATSGIDHFQLFVSDNHGPFTSVGTTGFSFFLYTPIQDGHTYSFYTLATDKAGNVEPPKTSGDATTVTNLNAPLLTELGNSQPDSPNLAPTAAKVKLPKLIAGAVPGGSTVSGILSVINNGPATATGPFSVSYYISDDTTLSAADTFITTIASPKPLLLRSRGTGKIPFSLTLPNTVSGTVNLLAYINPPSSTNTLAIPESTTLDNVASISHFNAAPVTLNLAAGTLKVKAGKSGKSSTALFTVTNPSNASFSGSVTLTLTLLDSSNTTVLTTSKDFTADLTPGKSAHLTFPFDTPATGGVYTVNITLTTSTSQSSTADDLATAPLKVVTKSAKPHK